MRGLGVITLRMGEIALREPGIVCPIGSLSGFLRLRYPNPDDKP